VKASVPLASWVAGVDFAAVQVHEVEAFSAPLDASQLYVEVPVEAGGGDGGVCRDVDSGDVLT
jgi:hypothetical protein